MDKYAYGTIGELGARRIRGFCETWTEALARATSITPQPKYGIFVENRHAGKIQILSGPYKLRPHETYPT